MNRIPLVIALSLSPVACSAQDEPPVPAPTSERTDNGLAEGFLAHLRSLADGTDAQVIPGAGDDLLLVRELRSMGVGPFWGEAAKSAGVAQKLDRRDALPAILAFDALLDADGTAWIFVPVPGKVAVDPTVVPDAPTTDGRVDVYHAEFYALLATSGVPILDVSPALRELVAGGTRAHCATDTHWTSAACKRVAEVVREHVGDADWLKGADPAAYKIADREVSFLGDMRVMLGDEHGAKETLPMSFVTRGGVPPANDPDSPILLVGDSHCLVFRDGGDMHAKGAGLADHLAARFGLPIHTVGVRGSGATQSRLSAFRAGAYDRKKLVIWCLSAREFTEATGGWSPNVPLRR